MMSGKSLTEHITELIKRSLSENNIQNSEFNSINKIKDLEDRLLNLESVVRNREYLSKKLKPFTNSEAINCTNFMRGIFDQEIEKRNFTDRNDAFDDLFKYIKIYDQLNQPFIDRFKEIMISDNPVPWTGKELNELIGEDKCN